MTIKLIRYGDGEDVEAICDFCGSENMSHVDDEWEGVYLNTGYRCDDCGEVTEATLNVGCEHDGCVSDATYCLNGMVYFCDQHLIKGALHMSWKRELKEGVITYTLTGVDSIWGWGIDIQVIDGQYQTRMSAYVNHERIVDNPNLEEVQQLLLHTLASNVSRLYLSLTPHIDAERKLRGYDRLQLLEAENDKQQAP